ncbi:MAG TPA: hypothetical protein VHC20_08310 [Candidatus Paceibacterota bacterium]|nr:hypothetical protein [Candidatus Paceibacterota bacterium]
MTTVSIRDVLVPALRQRFPARPFVEGVPPNPVATFPAAHSTVGDLLILDDGEEATVVIGRHTHSHFNPYDATLSPDQLAQVVTDSVLQFLTDLFDDRVLIWSVPGRSGGWTILPREPLRMPPDADKFLWSGPLPTTREPA